MLGCDCIFQEIALRDRSVNGKCRALSSKPTRRTNLVMLESFQSKKHSDGLLVLRSVHSTMWLWQSRETLPSVRQDYDCGSIRSTETYWTCCCG
jgi:hypothetical protein